MKPLRITRDISPRETDEIVGACRCGARWTGEAVAHCPTCHLTFASVAGFDDHRDRREGRCRSEAELAERGMEPNDAGQWRRPMPADRNPWNKEK
jgi:hypothetical protein